MSFRAMIDPNWAEHLPREPKDFVWQNNNNLDESLPIVDRLLEPQTMAHFMEFAFSGNLPTGEKTSLPLITDELIEKHLMVPYSVWAPGPHDKFNLSPFDHAMVRIGSKEDSARLVIVEKGVHAMKSRLWEGIMPMSENRWRQKRLDDPANHFFAIRQLGQVIEVFAYFQNPIILHHLSESYRLIYEHFRDFDRVYNGLPQNAGKPPAQVAALWEEFMTAHFTAITTRAHSWVVSKVQKLREKQFDLLLNIHPPASAGYTDEQMTILNRVQDLSELALRADYTIFVHMPKCDPPSRSLQPSCGQRRRQYGEAVRQRSRQAVIEDTFRNIGMGVRQELNSASSIVRSAREQKYAQDHVRRDMRFGGGEPIQLPPVGWIQKLKESIEHNEEKRWGFTAYRLTYKETDEEWAEFLKKLNDDLNDWGDDEDGAKDIKDMASLRWFDGKEIGLPEGDIEAAKAHFISLDVGGSSGRYQAKDFLVVDSHSYASYKYGSTFSSVLLPGDTGGFVTVVDTDFDPDDRGEHGEESPFYTGQLRILGNLVYPDLYAMLFAQTQGPEDLWPLAMNHPELIYTGTTVKRQVERWKKVNLVKFKLLEILGESIKTVSNGGN